MFNLGSIEKFGGKLLKTGVLALGLMGAYAADGLAQTPRGASTERDGLWVLASGSTIHVARELVSSFGSAYQVAAPPRIDSMATPQAWAAFCSGVGARTPDIFVTTRRASASAMEQCVARGVTEIVEVEIGLGALVLAVKKGDTISAITSEDVWRALAAEVVVSEEFAPNRQARWSDVSPRLPSSDIRFVVPLPVGSTRSFFENLVMEAGCRHNSTVRLIFEASYRRAKCITMRQDGRVLERPVDEIPGEILRGAPGTIGAVSLSQLRASGGTLVALELDGAVPSMSSIASRDYLPSVHMYVYAKKQHSRAQNGVGVVRGIREFMTMAVSEQMAGPDGRLSSTAGLVALDPDARVRQRSIAANQSTMSR